MCENLLVVEVVHRGFFGEGGEELDVVGVGAVIAIMIFVVVAVLSLIVYNVIPSTRNEEDYS